MEPEKEKKTRPRRTPEQVAQDGVKAAEEALATAEGKVQFHKSEVGRWTAQVEYARKGVEFAKANPDLAGDTAAPPKAPRKPRQTKLAEPEPQTRVVEAEPQVVTPDNAVTVTTPPAAQPATFTAPASFWDPPVA